MLYRRVEKLVITTTVNANHQTPLEPFLQASKSLKSNHRGGGGKMIDRLLIHRLKVDGIVSDEK